MIARVFSGFAAGDPLNPSDVNSISYLSRDWQRVFETEHNSDGNHRSLRVPVATAIFSQTFGTYTLLKSSGIVTTNGVGGWQKLGTGHLEITLSANMDSAEWGCDVSPFKIESPIYWHEDGDGFTKTNKATRIRFWTPGAGIVPIDTHFVFNAYGLRA